jgi:hypothetical protein
MINIPADSGSMRPAHEREINEPADGGQYKGSWHLFFGNFFVVLDKPIRDNTPLLLALAL